MSAVENNTSLDKAASSSAAPPTLVAPPTRRQRKKESKADISSAKKASLTTNGKMDGLDVNGTNKKSRRKNVKMSSLEDVKSTISVNVDQTGEPPSTTTSQPNSSDNSQTPSANLDDVENTLTSPSPESTSPTDPSTINSDVPSRQRASSSSFYCVDSDEKDNGMFVCDRCG